MSTALAISFGAMSNANDGDFIWRQGKNDAVVPASNAKVALPSSSERPDIAGARSSVIGQRVEDSNGNLTIGSPVTPPVWNPAK